MSEGRIPEHGAAAAAAERSPVRQRAQKAAGAPPASTPFALAVTRKTDAPAEQPRGEGAAEQLPQRPAARVPAVCGAPRWLPAGRRGRAGEGSASGRRRRGCAQAAGARRLSGRPVTRFCRN